MPTKRLNTSGNEELISHIKDSLANHEESYAPGAWENFNKKEERGRGLIFWIGGLSSAAAVLLIAFGLFYNSSLKPTGKTIDNTVTHQPTEGVQNAPDQLNVPSQSMPQVSSTGSPSKQPNGSLGKGDIGIGNQLPEVKVISKQNDSVIPSIQQLATLIPTNPPVETPQKVQGTVASEPSRKPVITLDEFLAKETEHNRNATATTKKDALSNKWDLGVVVAPSFGNTNKLNMGYGLSMAYNVSNKVSIGSGLSYNEMGATKDAIQENAYDAAPANALLSDTKSLQSMNTKVVGLDIPLELRYNLSNRFYANVGVSAFAVLNQQQNNVYLQGTVVQRTAVNPAGDQQTQSYFVTEKISEKSPEEVTKQSGKLLGFYNFSFGYKQKISKDKSIGIEPFLKVPMKGVTQENLYLMGTGLKVKFDF